MSDFIAGFLEWFDGRGERHQELVRRDPRVAQLIDRPLLERAVTVVEEGIEASGQTFTPAERTRLVVELYEQLAAHREEP